MTPTDACATPIIDRIKRLIRDLEAGAILGYDGPQEHWSTRMGAEASSEVARLLSAALALEAGADDNQRMSDEQTLIQKQEAIIATLEAALTTSPASSEAVAKHIVQGVCELQEFPDIEDPDTIIVTADDLEAVICNRLASFRSSPASSGVEGEAVDAVKRAFLAGWEARVDHFSQLPYEWGEREFTVYALTTSPASSVCAARKQGTAGGNDPADCDWPFCGCDPHADKVIAALQECGWSSPASSGVEGEAVEALQDKIDGLEADLDSAVEVAFNRGATEWVRLNYPDHYNRLSASPAPQTEGK